MSSAGDEGDNRGVVGDVGGDSVAAVAAAVCLCRRWRQTDGGELRALGDVEGYLSDGVTVSAPGVSVQSGEGLSVSVVSTASVLSGGCVVAEAGELVIVSAGRGCGSRPDRAVGGDSCGDTLATAGAAVRVVSGDRLTEVSG